MIRFISGDKSYGMDDDSGISEAHMRMLDRICLLETHVNWRLLGLPANVSNIRLERLGVMNGFTDVDRILRIWYSQFESRDEVADLVTVMDKVPEDSEIVICASQNIIKGWGQICEKSIDKNVSCQVIVDTDDIFCDIVEGEIEDLHDSSITYVKSSFGSYLGALKKNTVGLFWTGTQYSWQNPLKWSCLVEEMEARLVSESSFICCFSSSCPYPVLPASGWLEVSESLHPGLIRHDFNKTIYFKKR